MLFAIGKKRKQRALLSRISDKAFDHKTQECRADVPRRSLYPDAGSGWALSHSVARTLQIFQKFDVVREVGWVLGSEVRVLLLQGAFA